MTISSTSPQGRVFKSPTCHAPSRPAMRPHTLFRHASAAALTRPFSCSASGTATAAETGSAAAAASAGRWFLSLERGVGKANGAEAELQATGAFGAEVFPDLPIATTWQNFFKALTGGLGGDTGPVPHFTEYATRPGALKVVTAAAQLRSLSAIQERLLQAAGETHGSAPGAGPARQRADALLCVSGSHPVRSLPLVARFTHSSLDTLRLARRLQQQGDLPASTQLWVVANPNTERDASLLERKVELGAQVVLTQPPLDWPAFLRWMDDAERRGLLAAPASLPPSEFQRPTTASAAAPQPGSHAAAAPAPGTVRLLVGHPVLSSATNASFWMALSGCGGSAEARRLVEEAGRAEAGAGGKDAVQQYFLELNKRLVDQVVQRGGASGLHVMPITKAAKRMVLAMVADGTLTRGA